MSPSKFDESVLYAKRLGDKVTVLKKENDELRKLLYDYMDKNNLDKHTTATNGDAVTISKVDRVKIDYDVDKLKAKLPGELFNEIVTKFYEVVDMRALIAYMKKAGVSQEDFKRCIKATTFVNKEAIRHLFSVGDIKMEDIKGCYEAQIAKGVSIKTEKGE